MNFEQLNLTDDNQNRVDSAFLDAAIDRLNVGRQNLSEEAISELEAIKGRTFERAHDDIIGDRPLSPAIAYNLGKLSFIDTISVPTHERISRRKLPKQDRVYTGYGYHRRLFRGKINL